MWLLWNNVNIFDTIPRFLETFIIIIIDTISLAHQFISKLILHNVYIIIYNYNKIIIIKIIINDMHTTIIIIIIIIIIIYCIIIIISLLLS